MEWQGQWLWTAAPLRNRNRFVRFRRRFDYRGGAARLHLTADSRYALYVNGEYLGRGPVRAWPHHARYDTYDLQPHLRPGLNVVAVLVQHLGESTFQYLDGPPGLLAQLELADEVLASDSRWRAAPDASFVGNVPRISCQLGFEEQVDARLDDNWVAPDYDDSAWPAATELRPAADGHHNNLAPRGIPHLTHEPLLPQRVVSLETVRSQPLRATVYLKPYLFPADRSANMMLVHAYLATVVESPEEAEVRLVSPHQGARAWKLNGQLMTDGRGRLKQGSNELIAQVRQQFHLAEVAMVLEDAPPAARFATVDGTTPLFLIAGPFAPGDEELRRAAADKDDSLLLAAAADPACTAEAGEAFWEHASLEAPGGGDVCYRDAVLHGHRLQVVQAADIAADDVFVRAYTDQVTDAPGRAENLDALLAGSDWTTIHPADGADVRLLLDFGRGLNALQRFQLDAPAGTVVDVHNFEFIQPDGRYNLAEGMNNSFRYICRDGRQSYQSWLHRGFRYSYVIFRELSAPVKLRRVQALFHSYPQRRVGQFASADAQLDRIWEAGALSLRCCAEDTYTDCPTYEQTNWIGDARNEALVDWAINGDPRLWYRCLEQTGQSLDRSPITESHVPSGWRNLLPAWSFLWMRSCREYLLYSGDRAGAARLLAYLDRNVAGLRGFLNADGLLDIRAWNMFDWAAMDTPTRGVVTHQNCLAVHALRDAGELAEWLGEPGKAAEWRTLAAALTTAINQHLWVEERGAYTDCLRDGGPSEVFSQQTQTAACMAGVAAGEREARCRAAMHHPPEGFVVAGSPFFEFFLLEAYQQEGRDQEFLDTILRDWGFMVDMGATTFWEMWSGRGGRLTRSHCHGWSAAPTYFLSTWVLGVRPGGVGFSPCLVEPHPGDLRWCRGIVPTPHGTVEVQWENEPGQPFALRLTAPPELPLTVRLPRAGSATLNGEPIDVDGAA